MKNFKKRAVVIWLVLAAIAGIVGNEVHQYYENLMGQKDDRISILTDKIIDLERELTESRALLGEIQGGVDDVTKEISLQFNVTKKKQIEAIDEFRSSIRNLKIVSSWQKNNNIDIESIISYHDFSRDVSQKTILDAMYSVCGLNSFHRWLMEENTLTLPRKAILDLSEYFYTMGIYCEFIPENIARINKDSWFIDIAFANSGLVVLNIESINDNYNKILSSSSKVIRMLDREENKLQE